jgi:hypothetical protein
MALLARLRPREAQKFTAFSNGSGEYLQLSKSAPAHDLPDRMASVFGDN